MTTRFPGDDTGAAVARPTATIARRRGVATTTDTAVRGAASYEALLEHAPEALLVVELGQRCFRVVNGAAERLLRFTRAELLGLGPEDVSDAAEAQRLVEVRAHLAAHGVWHGQWALRRKDASIVQTDATVVRVAVGGRVLIQGLFRERTEQSADALVRAHDVQHHLNNQLALITGYAELLALDPRLPADLRDAAREALAGGLGAVEVGKLLIACFTAER